MKKTLQRGAAASLAAFVAASCGAKTGLLAPEPDPPSQCVSLQATASIADLDVFTMMDASGSMEYSTADGSTKWQAVRAALASFFLDAESAGIGAAISFFPIVDPSVPEMCVAPTECGGPVENCKKYSLCYPSGGEFCETAEDCAAAGLPDDTCEKLGFCENDLEQPCLLDVVGLECAPDQGLCLGAGFCENHFDCKLETYEKPVVDVTKLPAGAESLLDAIDSRIPDGGTTTLPALAAAIQRAAKWTAENPGHKAIVVLATDGLPTSCDPALDGPDPQQGIQHLVDVAAEGVKIGVETFVIGVFGPEEQAEAAPNLDAIAAGGGTKSAFLISTEANVQAEFFAALSEVRVTAKSCEFGIPLVDGNLPDLERMTVWITPPGGQAIEVPRVDGEASCDPVTGGFFYDKPVGSSPPPGRVILCPASCGLFGSAADRKVELRVSCE